MKFLLDMNLPISLGEHLLDLGFQYRHISQIADVRTSDFDILQIATLNDEVILTHDLDFGELLAISGVEKPSVVIFRIHRINAIVFFDILKSNFTEDIIQILQDGALIIVDERNIRIRNLPLKRVSFK